MLIKLDRKVEWGANQAVRSEFSEPPGLNVRLPIIQYVVAKLAKHS